MSRLSNKCSDIQDIIVRAAYDKISEQEDALLRKHLEACTGCRNFALTVENMEKILDPAGTWDIVPDPRIRENLLRRMKSLQLEKKRLSGMGTGKSWVEKLGNLVRYRIPVYQAAIMLVLLVALFIGFFPSHFQENRAESGFTSEIYYDSLALYQVDITGEMRRIGTNQSGRNLKEDSILVRYLSGAL